MHLWVLQSYISVAYSICPANTFIIIIILAIAVDVDVDVIAI